MIVHQRKDRFFSLIIVITLVLTGLYLDTAVEDALFSYTSKGEVVFCRQLFQTDINTSKICSRTMLDEYGDMQQSARFYPLLSMLYVYYHILSQGKYYRKSEDVQAFFQTPDGLVTNYMHQSDGKKRN